MLCFFQDFQASCCVIFPRSPPCRGIGPYHLSNTSSCCVGIVPRMLRPTMIHLLAPSGSGRGSLCSRGGSRTPSCRPQHVRALKCFSGRSSTTTIRTHFVLRSRQHPPAGPVTLIVGQPGLPVEPGTGGWGLINVQPHLPHIATCVCS